jgi:O-antigen/teichoic acid export membrane protein
MPDPSADTRLRTSGNSNSLRSRLLLGGSFAFAGLIVSGLGSFVANVLFARLLTPSEFGAYTLAFSLVVLAVVVGVAGVDQATVRLAAAAPENSSVPPADTYLRNGFFLAILGGSLTAALISLLTPYVTGVLLNAPILAGFGVFLGIWVLFSVLQRQVSESFRSQHDIFRASLFAGIGKNGVVFNVLLLLAALVFYAKGDVTLTQALGAVLLAVILSFGAGFFRLGLHHRKGRVSRRVCRQMLGIGTPLALASLLHVGRMQFDLWLVAHFTSPDDVALYGAAVRLVNLVGMSLLIVNAVVPPIISELHERGERERLQRVLRGVATVAGLPAIVALVLMILFGQLILGLVYGEFYKDAAVVLGLLSVGRAVSVLAGSCAISLTMTGHERTWLKITITALVLLVLGGYLAGARYGATGVAAVSAAVAIFQNVAALLAVRRSIGIWTIATLSPHAISAGFRSVLGR